MSRTKAARCSRSRLRSRGRLRMTRARPAAAQPLPPPQKFPSVNCRLPSSQMCASSFFSGFQSRLPEALDLRQRLVVEAHRRQKRRRAVESVRPHLRRVEDVVEHALRVARRLDPNPVQQSVDRLPHLRVAGPLGGLRVGRAAHRGIGRAAGDHHAQPPVRRALHDGRLGQQNHPFAVSRLQQRLRQNALLPVAPLHGHGRRRGLLDPPRAFGSRFAPGTFAGRTAAPLEPAPEGTATRGALNAAACKKDRRFIQTPHRNRNSW